jgi:hypothetical protein
LSVNKERRIPEQQWLTSEHNDDGSATWLNITLGPESRRSRIVMCDRGLNKLFKGERIGITEDSLTYGRELVLLHPRLHPLGVRGGLEGPSIPLLC